MTHPVSAATHKIHDPTLKPPWEGPGQPDSSGYTIECASKPGSKAGKPSWPPCLVNLFLDGSHAHHFALTGDRLSLLSGAPGSCLDALISHVGRTVGTDAFLRALGTTDPHSLRALFAKALAAQGHSTSTLEALPDPLARMTGKAGLVLLQDRISKSVLAKLETHDAVASLLEKDGRLRRLLLARVSEVNDEAAQVGLLAGFGLRPIEAKKVAKLLGAWIPHEIKEPTAQSAPDVARAEKILLKGIARVGKMIEDLVPEIRHWQLSTRIDLVADLGPEVDAAFKQIGLPLPGKGTGNVLEKAIEAHVAALETDRNVDEGIRIAVGLVTGLLGTHLADKAGEVPGILADKRRLEDLLLLEGMGAASAQAVDEARDDLIASLLSLAVDVF